MLKNKRADFQSIVVMIVIVFALAIGSILFSKVFLDITSEMKAMPEIQAKNNTMETIELVENKTIPLLDFLVFFSLISLMIGLIISSIYINTHPAITIVFVVAMFIAVFLSGQITNIYSEIIAEPEIAPTAAEFKLTGMILGEHFPLIILFVCMVVIVVLYGKSRQGGIPT